MFLVCFGFIPPFIPFIPPSSPPADPPSSPLHPPFIPLFYHPPPLTGGGLLGPLRPLWGSDAAVQHKLTVKQSNERAAP